MKKIKMPKIKAVKVTIKPVKLKKIKIKKSKDHDKVHRAKKPKAEGKIGKVMEEYKHGELHSGSKKGPKVKNRKQAIAIALSEAREAGEKIKGKKNRK